MSSLAVAAVDVAATRGRVVVGQFAGDRLTFTTAHEFPVNYVRFGDHCYWELGGIHEQILTGLRKARTAFPGLAGCGVDFWGCDHVLLGKGDRLLQPVHSYRDHRTGKILNVLSSTDREQLYAWTGIPPLLYNTSFQLAESLQTLPNLRDRIQRCLFLAEYINLLLTGEAINEISAVSSGQLLQLTRHQYSHETFNFFGIPADWFSGPAIAGRLLGRIRGIKDLDGLEVTLVPAHDTACAFEAMPSFGVSPLLVTGTTWILAGFRNRTPYDRPDGCYLGISNERCGDGSYRPTRILLGLWLVDRLLKSFDQVPASEQEWEQLHAAVQRVPHSRQVLSTFNPGLLNPVDMRQAIDEHLRAENRPLPATLPSTSDWSSIPWRITSQARPGSFGTRSRPHLIMWWSAAPWPIVPPSARALQTRPARPWSHARRWGPPPAILAINSCGWVRCGTWTSIARCSRVTCLKPDTPPPPAVSRIL